ncbi:unnamed protein product, partial [Sphenostylis stenocarpa]
PPPPNHHDEHHPHHGPLHRDPSPLLANYLLLSSPQLAITSRTSLTSPISIATTIHFIPSHYDSLSLDWEFCSDVHSINHNFVSALRINEHIPMVDVEVMGRGGYGDGNGYNRGDGYS